MKTNVKRAFMLLLTVGALLSACRTRVGKKPTHSTTDVVENMAALPDVNSISSDDEFVSKAVEATGGSNNWIETSKIECSPVVTFYLEDAGEYIAQHKYEVFPWSAAIQITSREMAEEIIWRFKGGDFDVMKGSLRVDRLSGQYNPSLAGAVLESIIAPARLLKKGKSKSVETVRLQGQTYYAIEKYNPNSVFDKNIYYQNKKTNIVDTVWNVNLKKGLYLRTKAYGFHEISKKGIFIPSQIEVFRTDSSGIDNDLLLKVLIK